MIIENSERDEIQAEDEVGKLPQIVLETGETVSVSEDTTEKSPAVASKTELGENSEREVVGSNGSKVGSVVASGRERKVQGGEILDSASASH